MASPRDLLVNVKADPPGFLQAMEELEQALSAFQPPQRKPSIADRIVTILAYAVVSGFILAVLAFLAFVIVWSSVQIVEVI